MGPWVQGSDVTAFTLEVQRDSLGQSRSLTSAIGDIEILPNSTYAKCKRQNMSEYVIFHNILVKYVTRRTSDGTCTSSAKRFQAAPTGVPMLVREHL